MKKNISYDELMSKVSQWIDDDEIKFLFVSGNGGSGKTTFARQIKEGFESRGGGGKPHLNGRLYCRYNS